jgi:hypothetical protein
MRIHSKIVQLKFCPAVEKGFKFFFLGKAFRAVFPVVPGLLVPPGRSNHHSKRIFVIPHGFGGDVPRLVHCAMPDHFKHLIDFEEMALFEAPLD